MSAASAVRLDARARRRYIERAAESLCRRSPSPSALEGLSWDALAHLPHWCLLDDTGVQRLRALCGAVYLLPAIRGSVHGAFLKRVRERIGPEAFTRLLRCEVRALPPIAFEPGEPVLSGVIDAAGASVLLGTLSEPLVRGAFIGLLGSPRGVLAPAVAEPLYLLASRIDADVAAGPGGRAKPHAA